QDASSLVAAAALGEHVGQSQLACLQARGQQPSVSQPLGIGVACHIERHQRPGESEKRVASPLVADTEMGEAPLGRCVEVRGEPPASTTEDLPPPDAPTTAVKLCRPTASAKWLMAASRPKNRCASLGPK